MKKFNLTNDWRYIFAALLWCICLIQALPYIRDYLVGYNIKHYKPQVIYLFKEDYEKHIDKISPRQKIVIIDPQPEEEEDEGCFAPNAPDSPKLWP